MWFTILVPLLFVDGDPTAVLLITRPDSYAHESQELFFKRLRNTMDTMPVINQVKQELGNRVKIETKEDWDRLLNKVTFVLLRNGIFIVKIKDMPSDEGVRLANGLAEGLRIKFVQMQYESDNEPEKINQEIISLKKKIANDEQELKKFRLQSEKRIQQLTAEPTIPPDERKKEIQREKMILQNYIDNLDAARERVVRLEVQLSRCERDLAKLHSAKILRWASASGISPRPLP